MFPPIGIDRHLHILEMGAADWKYGTVSQINTAVFYLGQMYQIYDASALDKYKFLALQFPAYRQQAFPNLDDTMTGVECSIFSVTQDI